MDRLKPRPYRPESVSVPGETIQDTLDALGLTQASLAERTGKSQKAINEIVQGKSAITPDTALQLERVLGVPASFWLAREARYREWLAKKNEEKADQPALDWMRSFPVSTMQKLGWMNAGSSEAERLDGLLKFFGVVNPDAWESVWSQVQPMYRRSACYQSDVFALTAWLRQGERIAQSVQTGETDSTSFVRALDSVRELTNKPAHEAFPDVFRVCASAGVVVVLVEELPKTHVSGATRWLTPTKALLQLSFRYRTEDHLWFTLFHEAGHILRHGKKELFVDESGSKCIAQEQEDEANRFASESFVPTRELNRFLPAWDCSISMIQEFATRLRVAPGIVVGRLQHDSHLPPSHGNRLKRKLNVARLKEAQTAAIAAHTSR